MAARDLQARAGRGDSEAGLDARRARQPDDVLGRRLIAVERDRFALRSSLRRAARGLAAAGRRCNGGPGRRFGG